MFTEQEFLIHVYCLVCQYYHRLFPDGVRRAGYGPQLTDAEAITIAIVGEYLDLDTDKAIYEYFERHYQDWFPDLPCRTTLVRQWANLWIVTQKIWQAIVHDSGHNFDDIQIIDTVPIPVCHPRRASTRQIFCDDILGTPDHGYCASKDWHYFGFKGGIRISVAGMIVKAPLLDARAHDINSLDALLNGVPAQTTILGDKGFIDEKQQERKDKEYGILIKTPLRSNMSDRPRFRITKLEQRVRGLVETVIGQLTERFSIQDMKVRKGWTLMAKWYRKILAHTVCVFTNLCYGRQPTELESIVN